jgi:hypothetical protein
MRWVEEVSGMKYRLDGSRAGMRTFRRPEGRPALRGPGLRDYWIVTALLKTLPCAASTFTK